MTAQTPEAPPTPRPAPRLVHTACGGTYLALQFTGHNAQDIKAVCTRSPGPGFDAGFVDGPELVLGQPCARVYDARTASWPMVPVGYWVIADGVGVKVESDPWFRALFTDTTGAEAVPLHTVISDLMGAVGELVTIRQALNDLAQGIGARPDAGAPEAGFTFRQGDGAPTDPWSAAHLTEVPRAAWAA